jgi:hypothetical protein
MTAMAELSLTLDLWGNVLKHFFTETTGTIETKLIRNVHLMGLYKFSFFYADWKSKLATISSHRFMGDQVRNQSLEGPQTLCFLCCSEFQDDYHCRT